jgi:hypothetical protein
MQHFLKGRDHLDAFGVNGRIILKHIPWEIGCKIILDFKAIQTISKW